MGFYQQISLGDDVFRQHFQSKRYFRLVLFLYEVDFTKGASPHDFAKDEVVFADFNLGFQEIFGYTFAIIALILGCINLVWLFRYNLAHDLLLFLSTSHGYLILLYKQ